MKTIELDARRRTNLGRVGKKEHTLYLVTEYDDGSVRLTPAKYVPISDLGNTPQTPR